MIFEIVIGIIYEDYVKMTYCENSFSFTHSTFFSYRKINMRLEILTPEHKYQPWGQRFIQWLATCPACDCLDSNP